MMNYVMSKLRTINVLRGLVYGLDKNIYDFVWLFRKFVLLLSLGEVAEWSIAAVLKTVELRGSGGSNPSLSASSGKIARLAFCESFFVKRSSVNKFTSGRLSNKSKSRLCRYSCYFSACKLRSKGRGVKRSSRRLRSSQSLPLRKI